MSLGAASAHRVRCTAHKTEIHHESNVAPAWSNTAVHKMLIWVQDPTGPIVVRDSRPFGQELSEAEVPIRVEAEVANRAVDAVPIDPNVRVSEPVEPAAAAGGQPAVMEVNTDPVIQRAGGAAPTGELLDRTKYITCRKKELDQLESFGVIRRAKKNEATDGAHVRMKIIAHNKGDLVRWRLVGVEVKHYERHDVFAGTPALKVFRVLLAKAASQSHPEHGHRKVIAILDVAVAFFHADMGDKKNAHPPAEAEPDRTVVWLLIKTRYGTRKAARVWQDFLRNEVFMKACWDAVAVEPNVHRKSWESG